MTARIMQFIVVICLLFMTVAIAIPKSEDRVQNKPLSDENHFEGSEHNPDYDHEAFLGEEESKTFDQLKPEESKARLGKIVDKIDKDQDGYVTQEELKNWIQYTQKRYIREDVEKQWKAHNPDGRDKLSWEEYKKVTYGFAEDIENEQVQGTEDGITYKEMIRRDKRRWETADKDADGNLDREEFSDFLHPEETEHMKDIVVEETLEDIDKNKDGSISLEEYIGDMYGGAGEGEVEPDWVKNEREQFSNYRDKNNDGKMDKDEVREWILPTDYDHSEAEAKHLMYESDKDKDKKLTKEEILEKYDLFVGSQATDFGEALVRHDEF